jgi:hypothetical protein
MAPQRQSRASDSLAGTSKRKQPASGKVGDIDAILRREAKAFDRELEREDDDRRPWGRPRLPSGEVGQIYSLRIPVERLAALQQLADRRGVQPTSLMRKWVLERLKREERKASKPNQVVGEPKAKYGSAKTPKKGAKRG